MCVEIPRRFEFTGDQSLAGRISRLEVEFSGPEKRVNMKELAAEVQRWRI